MKKETFKVNIPANAAACEQLRRLSGLQSDFFHLRKFDRACVATMDVFGSMLKNVILKKYFT